MKRIKGTDGTNNFTVIYGFKNYTQALAYKKGNSIQKYKGKNEIFIFEIDNSGAYGEVAWSMTGIYSSYGLERDMEKFKLKNPKGKFIFGLIVN